MTGFNIIVQRVENDEVVHESRIFHHSTIKPYRAECAKQGIGRTCRMAQYDGERLMCSNCIQCNDKNFFDTYRPKEYIVKQWQKAYRGQ